MTLFGSFVFLDTTGLREQHRLFVMGPHSQDLDGLLLLQNLIYQSVLDIDAAGICAAQIAHQFFKWRRVLKGVLGEDSQQVVGFLFQIGRFEFSCIFFSLPSEND